MFKIITAAAFAATMGMAAQAASVSPTSYSMLNGETGSYQYWDESYGGPGATGNPGVSKSALSGGLGDLTDGYIETRNWNAAGVEPPAGAGPYVGWVTVDPTITFLFNQVHDFATATFYFDASYSGGVNPPQRVTINGLTQTVPTPPSAAPFAFVFDLGGVKTDTLPVNIVRTGWVFLSEVTFDANTTAAVPLPAGLGLLATALGGLGLFRMRRRTA
jgi:hypothetical protein